MYIEVHFVGSLYIMNLNFASTFGRIKASCCYLLVMLISWEECTNNKT